MEPWIDPRGSGMIVASPHVSALLAEKSIQP